jgi:DNA-directed RNA polymerase subunit RPC12/RpoP
MIEFTCTCGRPLRVSENSRTGAVACPDCGKEIVVPGNRAKVTDSRPSDRPDFVEDDRPRRRRRFEDEPEPAVREGAAGGTSTKALVSLVLGLASILLFCVTGLPALIVGFMALGDIGNSRGKLKGAGLAYTGITLGIIGMVLTVIVGPLALLFPAVMKVREAAERAQAMNNLKEMALAMHSYNDNNGCLPQAYTLIPSPDGGPPQPGMGWRVALLPYVEEERLYGQYNFQLPGDHPSNQYLQTASVRVYQFPKDTTTATNNTYFQVFVTVPGKSPHAMFDSPTLPPQRIGLGAIFDGTSNTIMIAEGTTAVNWASPKDLPFDPNQAPPSLGYHYRSVSLIALGDGSTRPITKPINPETLKSLITRDGNELIFDPDF